MNLRNELQHFNKLFADYESKFIRFANSYIRNLAVAEDIVMESFMHYWENRESLKSESNIPAYILTMIKNKSLNYLKHLRICEEVSEKIIAHAQWVLDVNISTLEACNPEELFSDEIQAIVEKSLKTLSPQTRQIFMMSRYQNMSNKEIASALSITGKGVEYHISKTIKQLKADLKDYLPFILW